MKTRERLNRIKKSKSWTERIALARDHLPGTKFDAFIINLLDTLQSCELHPAQKRKYFSPKTGVDLAAMNTDTLAAFGEDLARAIQRGNSKLFREWADAVDTWHNHKPQADKLRTAIIYFCVPPKEKFKMRDIIQHLREQNLVPKTSKESVGLDDLRRTIRRICKDFGIALGGKSGRPKK